MLLARWFKQLGTVFVGIVCVVLTCVEKRHGSSGLADSTMACFTCLPGAALLADWAVAINTLPPRDHPFFYTFAKTLYSIDDVSSELVCLAAIDTR